MSWTRKARNGRYYTYDEFVTWYGDDYGSCLWQEAEDPAGAQELSGKHTQVALNQGLDKQTQVAVAAELGGQAPQNQTQEAQCSLEQFQPQQQQKPQQLQQQKLAPPQAPPTAIQVKAPPHSMQKQAAQHSAMLPGSASCSRQQHPQQPPCLKKPAAVAGVEEPRLEQADSHNQEPGKQIRFADTVGIPLTEEEDQVSREPPTEEPEPPHLSSGLTPSQAGASSLPNAPPPRAAPQPLPSAAQAATPSQRVTPSVRMKAPPPGVFRKCPSTVIPGPADAKVKAAPEMPSSFQQAVAQMVASTSQAQSTSQKAQAQPSPTPCTALASSVDIEQAQFRPSGQPAPIEDTDGQASSSGQPASDAGAEKLSSNQADAHNQEPGKQMNIVDAQESGGQASHTVVRQAPLAGPAECGQQAPSAGVSPSLFPCVESPPFPPPCRSPPSPSLPPPSLVGAQPCAAERRVLFPASAITGVRDAALASKCNYGLVRKEARNELTRLINIQGSDGAGEPIEVSTQFHWPEYLALHPQAAALVGPGVVKFDVAVVAGTKDPNRGGLPRLDFVVHHIDGGYWRLHPGTKSKDDASPQYFHPAKGPQVDASDRWRYLPSGGFQCAHAATVPQTDRMNKTQAWAELESLSNGDLDAGPDAKFKWWLWLGNLGAISREVLGDGVVSASLHNQASNVKHITFTRADSTQVTVELSLRSACHFKLRLMPSVSTS